MCNVVNIYTKSMYICVHKIVPIYKHFITASITSKGFITYFGIISVPTACTCTCIMQIIIMDMTGKVYASLNHFVVSQSYLDASHVIILREKK